MDLKAEALKFSIELESGGMNKSIDKMKLSLQQKTRDALTKAWDFDFSGKQIERVQKKMEAGAIKISNIQQKMHDETVKIELFKDNSSKKRQLEEAKAEKARLGENLKSQTAATQDQFDKMDNLSKTLDMMRKKDEASRMAIVGKSVESFGDGMHEIFSDVTSGDVGNILGIIQKGAVKIQQVQAKAAAAKEVGAGGGMAKIAGVLGKLAPILMTIGAIAAGFAAIVKIVMDADAEVKGLQRSLLEGGVSVGDLVMQADDLNGALRNMRDAADSFKNNMDWGTQAEDQMKILGAYNEAGYTLKEMVGSLRKGEKEMNAYHRATATALTYSKLLGESAEKVSQDMTGMMEQLGHSLSGVRDNFAAIYDAAQMSGFGTKRFFGMVLQATTGMSMYNVRLEQTTSMLINLSKILGTKFGPEFFQKLTGQFSGDSAQEGMKKILLRGGKAVSATLQSQAEYTADGVMDIFKGHLGSGFSDGLKDIFGQEGTKLADQLSESDTRGEGISSLVSMLGKMNGKDQGAALVEIEKKMGSDAARQFQQLLIQTNGINGSQGEQATALRALGPGGVLADQMTRMMKTSGAKNMSELGEKLSIISQNALENMDGMDSANRDQMLAMATSTGAHWNDMKKLQERMGTEEFKGKEGQAKLLAEQTTQINTWGATATKDGRIWQAKLDENNQVTKTGFKALGDEKDLLMGRTKADEDIKDAMTEQEALAKMTADATTDMSAYLEMGVKYFLNGIYDTTQDIYRTLTGKNLNAEEMQARDKALNTQQGVSKDFRDQISQKSSQIKDVKSKRDQAKGPDRKEFEEQLKILRAEKAYARDQLKVSQKMEGSLRKLEGGFWINKTEAGIEKQVREGMANADHGRTPGQEGGWKRKSDGSMERVQDQAATFNYHALKRALRKSNPEELDALEKLEDAGHNIKDQLEEMGNENVAKQIAAQKAVSEKMKIDAAGLQKDADKEALGKITEKRAKAYATANQREALKMRLTRLKGGEVTDNQVIRAIRGLPIKGIDDMNKQKAEVDAWMGKQGLPKIEGKDFITTPGGQLINPSDKDTVMGFKKNGPIAKAFGNSGRNTINNFNLYNDGQQSLAAIVKAQRAGVIA